MDNLKIILALPVAGFALYLAVMNGMNFIRSTRRKETDTSGGPSMVPLVSIVIAWIAYAIAPEGNRYWVWIGPALDIGNWAVLIGVPYALLRSWRAPKQTSTPSTTPDTNDNTKDPDGSPPTPKDR